MAGPIHYEVYVRRTAPAAWALLIATEDRKTALETAEEQFQAKQAVAVRVTKETLDPETMEFNSLTILNLGLPEEKSKKKPEAAARPACGSPKELYAPHARALIGRVLEDWLKRHGVTAFELLHRPDLIEKLEASGVELQHAIQKVAIPESQATGQAFAGPVQGGAGGVELGLAGLLAMVFYPQAVLEQVAFGFAHGQGAFQRGLGHGGHVGRYAPDHGLQGLHVPLAAVEQGFHFVGEVEQAHQAAVPPLAAQDPPKQGGGQGQAGQAEGYKGIHAVFRWLGAVCTSPAGGGKPLSLQPLGFDISSSGA